MVIFWKRNIEGLDKTELIRRIDELLGEKAIEKYMPTKDFKVYIVDRDDAPSIVKGLMEFNYTRLCVIAGNDERYFRKDLSLTYIVAFDRHNLYIGIRTYLPFYDPSIESIAETIRAAWWNERENRDLYGIIFKGLKDPRKLVLPVYWPNNVHPWRKDYPYNKPVMNWKEDLPDYKPIKQYPEADVIGLGPYHLINDEPIHWRLYVKGEQIIDVEHRGFHNWRGIEKIGEGRLTYNQIPFIAERICGICGFSHAIAYVQTIESLARIDIPDRARYLRSLMLEIERVESHLLWIGIACHILGFDTGFMLSWKTREHIMHLAEILTGNRKTYGMVIVGGVRRDILQDRIKKAKDTIRTISLEYRELYNMLANNSILIRRTRNVGTLSREKAISYGVVGPVARGVGLDTDIRRDHPYAAYKELSFDIPVYSEGDVLSITLVRLDEVFVSLDLIDQILDRLPGGPLMTEVKEIPPNKEAVGYVEAPRGEDIHYVRSGMYNKVQRWRVRAPSYANIPAVKEMLKGYRLADAPIIYASVDPCLACTERYLVIDVRTGKKQVITDDYLRKISRKYTMKLG